MKSISKRSNALGIAIVLISFLFSLSSCNRGKYATLKGEIIGGESKDIILSILNIDKLQFLDTIKLSKDGKFSKRLLLEDESPNFFYLSYNNRRIASILVAPGEKVEISVDTLGKALSIRGAKEGEIYHNIYKGMVSSQKTFDSLTNILLSAKQLGDSERERQVSLELGRFYVNEKRAAIKDIITNPYNFSNIVYLFRQYNENLPLFASLNDGIYFLRVADSLKTIYPNSMYVKALENEAEQFTNSVQLSEKLKEAGEIAFPELSLPDLNSNIVNLSSLIGRPFMLLFWHSGDRAQKLLNAELVELYNKYASKNFEIYAVCVDTDKAYWAQIVSRFPWINVCDGLGQKSPVIQTYNLEGLPTMYLFDRQGNIVGKDIYDIKRLDSEISKL